MELHTFLYSAKLNGRTSRGQVQAVNSTQAIRLVQQSNEMFSGVSVRTPKSKKNVQSCGVLN